VTEIRCTNRIPTFHIRQGCASRQQAIDGWTVQVSEDNSQAHHRRWRGWNIDWRKVYPSHAVDIVSTFYRKVLG